MSTQPTAIPISTAPIESEGQVVGVFTLADGAQAPSVASVARPLTLDLVISDQTGLAELTFGLEREPFVLLLAGRAISGVVTRADLGKPAARTYFYLLLAELEMELAQVLRELELADDSILAALGSEPRRRAQELADRLQAQDAYVDLVACLSLQDLVQVAGKHGLRQALQSTGRSWQRTSKNLSALRNDVMHPGRKFASNDADWIRGLTSYINKVRALRSAVRSLGTNGL